MTADTDNTAQTQGLYVWQMDNMLAATTSLNGHWQLPQGHTAEQTALASKRIATDTRTIKPGDIFLALSGDNFDGHDYIETAISKGAVAAIVSRSISLSGPSAIPQLVVSDTRLALGQLAAYRRQQHTDLTVIAITGSSGK
ncbi:Mur ligase domain-containing protein, partial [Pseudoalteromonas sp. SIMBA_153]